MIRLRAAFILNADTRGTRRVAAWLNPSVNMTTRRCSLDDTPSSDVSCLSFLVASVAANAVVQNWFGPERGAASQHPSFGLSEVELGMLIARPSRCDGMVGHSEIGNPYFFC